MVEGISDGGFSDDASKSSSLNFGDVVPGIIRDEGQGEHRPAQQVAPGFFRGGTTTPPGLGGNPGRGGVGDTAYPIGAGGIPGVPGAPISPRGQVDAPPPRRDGSSFFGPKTPGPGARTDVAAAPPAGVGAPDVRDRDWRAHPFNERPAPGFFRQPVIPPNQRRQGADAQPPAPPAQNRDGGNTGGGTMRDQVTRMAPLVERSLDKQSGFWGNEMIGGVSGVLGGGPLARALDWTTKKHLASGEPLPGGRMGPLEAISAWWQRNHGLTENEQLLAPLFQRDGELSTEFRNRLPQLETAMKTMEARAEASKLAALSEADLAVMCRARLLDGQPLPPGVVYELPKADIEMLMKQRELAEKIDIAANELANMPKFDKPALTSQHTLLQSEIAKEASGVKLTGEAAFLKLEAKLPTEMSAAEVDLARRFKYFSDYHSKFERSPLGTTVNLDPADYHIKLSASEEALIKNLKTPQELETFINNHLKAQGELALEKLDKAAEKILDANELRDLRRNEFYKAYAKDLDRTPGEFKAHLDGEHAANVDRFRNVSRNLEEARFYELKEIDLHGFGGELRKLESQHQNLLARLKQQAEPFESRLKQSAESLMSPKELEAYKALKTKYEFFERGAVGEVPRGVTLTAEEAALYAKRQAYRDRIGLLNPWAAPQMSKLLAEKEMIGAQMVKLADGMTKDVGDIMVKIESRPIGTRLVNGVPVYAQAPVESVLTKEELALWNRYKYLKSGGKTVIPAFEGLTQAEAKLITQMADLEKSITNYSRGDAVAASTWFARRDMKGLKIGEGHFSNFARGMATVAAADFISDRIDNHIWGPSHRGVTPYMTAVTPWVGMMMPGGWLKKGGAMVGLNMLGGYVEHALPIDNKSSWNRILRPNGVDAGFLALAATIPMRNESVAWRLGYMGIAWAGSKGLRYAFEGPSPREIRDKAWVLFGNDKSERSADTMTSTIDKLKELDNYPIKGDARQHMTVLEYYLADWMSRDHSKDELNGDRGNAMFLAAAGEARLARGTRVPKGEGSSDEGKLKQLWNAVATSFTSGSDQQFDYIIAGKNYDLGGQALKFLASAKIEVERAKEQTNLKVGTELRGKPVTRAEIEGLNTVGKRLDESLEKIYGRHDIPALYKEVQEYTINLNQKTMGKVRDQIKATIKSPGTDDPRFVAKFYRDLALIDLAWAGNKIGDNGVGSGRDGESAMRMLGEAKLALQKARELDPSPKKEDCDQLDAIFKRLESKVGVAIQAQWADNLFNPLNTPRNPQVPRPQLPEYKFGVNK